MHPRDLPAGLPSAFGRQSPPATLRPLGRGLIHETWLASYPGRPPLVHQRINPRVFPHPEPLLDNVLRVTRHLGARFRAQPDAHRRHLTLVSAVDGAPGWADGTGRWWRTYLYIEGAANLEGGPTPAQAESAAKAFGRFTALLADLPGPPLHETLAGFHDTPARLRHLERAIQSDPARRASDAASEIRAVRSHGDLAAGIEPLLARGELPRRPAHNDTKLDNVLFDQATGEALCVVDLDTVMPGSPLYDFGDLVRSASGSVPSEARRPLIRALVHGWMGEMGPLLVPAEMKRLALAPRVITLELAARFLADHLEGDHYFQTDHPDHNLERCRGQLDLLEWLDVEQDWMDALIAG